MKTNWKLTVHDGSVVVVKESDLPKKPDPIFCDIPSREATEEEIQRSGFKNHWPEYRQSLKTALSTKALKVTNVTQFTNFLRFESQAGYILFRIITGRSTNPREPDLSYIKDPESTLYDLPEGFEVNIEVHTSCDKCNRYGSEECDECLIDRCKAQNKQVATIVRSAPVEAPAEEKHGNPVISAVTAAQFGTPDQIADVEAHMKEYFERWLNYKDRLTYLEWYHIFLDFHDYIKSKYTLTRKP